MQIFSLSPKKLCCTAALTLMTVASLPLRADRIYLFAVDRLPNPTHRAIVHRFEYKTEGSAIADETTWGSGNAEPYQGAGLNGLTLGPDGDLYAVNSNAKSVLRIDGATGIVKKTVVTGLNRPEGLAIGKDGNLYVADGNAILRYKLDGTPLPGAEQIGSKFATGGPLVNATGLTFGPDGNLYVTAYLPFQYLGRILRYDGRSGEYMGFFHEDDLHTPGAIAFGPDGNLYVACTGGPSFDRQSGSVVKLNGKTGALIGTFAPEAKGALGLAFSPNGELLVSDYWNGKITRYDGKTGAPRGVFANNPDGTSFYSIVFAKTVAGNSALEPLVNAAATKANAKPKIK